MTRWEDFFNDSNMIFLHKIIDLALEEDGSDLTSEALFADKRQLKAVILAKEDTLIAGLPLIELVFSRLKSAVNCNYHVAEASFVKKSTKIVTLEADAVSMLRAERIILNLLCHLSGVANLTARYVRVLKNSGIKVLDTRKTLPGLRLPEKYAVLVGGGLNHRKNLAEILMLKDNHIDAAGSITQAVKILRETYQPCPKIEVECRNFAEVEEALAAKVERVMLDNMSAQMLQQSLDSIPKEVECEVSGGIALENIHEILTVAKRLPDFISVGRLTHSAPAADLSMIMES